MVRRYEMDDSVLMNDYTFLEDTARVANAASCHAVTVGTMPSVPSRSKRAILKREAARRKIYLFLMPQGMSRSARNSTYCRGRAGKCSLFWHVEVVFVNGGQQYRVSIDALSELMPLAGLIDGARNSLTSRKGNWTCRSRKGLSFAFSGIPIDDLDVYLLNEHIIGQDAFEENENIYVDGKPLGDDNMHKYVAVEKSENLDAILRNRIIIEFPIFYVCQSSSCDSKVLAEAKVGVFEKPDEDEDDSECTSSDNLSDGEIAEEPSSSTQNISNH